MATEEQLRLRSSPSSMATEEQLRHLSSDIIFDIISKLPFEDIIRCSFISTDFYQTIKNLHCSNHLSNTKSQVFDVLLAKTSHMPFDYYVGVIENLHLISSKSKSIDGKCKHIEIPHKNELTGRIVGSCNGLLCLAHKIGPPYAIYNPITNEKMMLPKFKFDSQCKQPFAIRSGFGYDPVNDKYKVVVTYNYEHCGTFRLKTTGDIITLGESSWRRLQFPKGGDLFYMDMGQPAVFINGSFHWVNGRQDGYLRNTYQLCGILTLDISTEEFSLIDYSAIMNLDVSYVRVLNIGNSLALAGEKYGRSWGNGDDGDPVPTQVWKLLGTKPDGSCLYQYMALNVGERIKRLLINKLYLTLIGALDNGNFLFKASECVLKGGIVDYLVLYETEKNECSIHEVSAEVPKGWDATIFQPSLVSPPCLRELFK